jgi:very-short-patch-repair endonuclease
MTDERRQRAPRAEVARVQGRPLQIRNFAKPEKKAYAREHRRHMTPSECALWQAIRGGALGLRFRRQAVVLGWIADFWCPAVKLVVEVDGGYHSTPERRAIDARRDAHMASYGIRVVRLTNELVNKDLPGALKAIQVAAGGVS